MSKQKSDHMSKQKNWVKVYTLRKKHQMSVKKTVP